MGLQIRDDRQMKALTGLSQAQFDHLLYVFSETYRATQQKPYEEGVAACTRRRRRTWRWLQRETANHGGEIRVCSIIIKRVAPPLIVVPAPPPNQAFERM